MGKRLSQLNQVDRIEKEDYLLVDGEGYLESKKIALQDVDISKFNIQNFYEKIEGNFVKKDGDKGLSSNDFTDEDKNKLDTSQEKLISGSNIKTINGESILGSGNIEVQGESAGAIDQTYNPTSENAQSGKAVAEGINKGIKDKISFWQPNTEYKVGDVVIENFDNGYMGNPRTGILRCVKNHTSSDSFNQDYLGDSKWEQKMDVWARYSYYDYLGNLISEHYATKKEVGDIETALDSIIEIQNQLIGGNV